MAEPAPPARARRPVDEVALARVLRRLRAAGGPPWLHGEVARRMGERLPLIRQQPDLVLDWWAALGGGAAVLKQAYPKARIVAVEPTAAARAPWWSTRRWAGASEAIAEADVQPGRAGLVWANMMLHGAADPQAVMAQWSRALAVGGFLMFSTLGPGTLEDLGAAWKRAGWPPPLAPFVDMHDLGDMLVEAGFADPVMDQETLTLTWQDAGALIGELRTLGGNVDPRRHVGLRTPRWRRAMADVLAALPQQQGRPALRFEVVYGHAFKATPRMPVATEAAIGVEDLRAMARTRRRTE